MENLPNEIYTKIFENLIVSLRLENFMINDGFTAIINDSYYTFFRKLLGYVHSFYRYFIGSDPVS